MKIKSITGIAILSSIVILSSSSCIIGGWDCVEGEGKVVSKEIKLDAFDQLELSCPAKVFLEQASEQKVVIKAQQNIIDMLKTNVKNGEWDIEFEKCIKNAGNIEFYVSMPEVKSVEIAGSGEILGKSPITSEELELEIAGSGNINLDIKVDELETEIAGSGDIALEGSTNSYSIEINGSGDVSAYGLTANDVEVEINGSGDVKVNAEQSIDVEVNGSGDVFYKGNPQKVSTDINGSGKIKKEG